MNKPAVFVTGTDTGVGKTFVSCALTRGLTQLNKRVTVFKPIAAGCEHINGQWCNEDALMLQHAAGNWQSYPSINPYALPAAIAPHIAAAEAGISISVDDVVAQFEATHSQSSDFIVVEGAGGFLVPLNEQQSFADIVVALKLPVILVVAMRLGCINHTLLSIEAIRSRGLTLLGWVANQAQAETMSRYAENLLYLKTHIAAPLLAELPWQQNDAEREKVFARSVLSASSTP